MSEKIPSGWYPDPSESGQVARRERWWNGTAWTAHTRDALRPGGDAPGAAATDTVAPGPDTAADEPPTAVLPTADAAGGAPSGPGDQSDHGEAPAAGPGPGPDVVSASASVSASAETAGRAEPAETAETGSPASDAPASDAPASDASAVDAPVSAPGEPGDHFAPPGAAPGPGGYVPPPPGAPGPGPVGAPGVPGGPGVPGPGFYGEPYPKRPNWFQRNAALVATGVVALLVGGGLGAGITYAATSGSGSSSAASSRTPGFGGGQNRGGDSGGLPGRGGSGGGKADTALDYVDGISLPIPSGWSGGTDASSGHAGLTYGSYTCSWSKYGCSLGGVNTGKISGSKAPQAAAESDIAGAAKEAYGDLKSHNQVEAKKVTVAGADGYLIRWKVVPTHGNDGYVETVVFPLKSGSGLASVHFGFDIAARAPSPSLMDTIVSGIKYADVSGAGSGGGVSA